MPIGNQSLQNYISTVYTTMVASTYKANIDSDTAIASNVAGCLYVYPNNPVALNVLVDPAFDLPQVGFTDPYLLNGAASPVTVSLTAPGSNSYYACIYWDLTTSTAGVAYGATGVSPTRRLPDKVWQVPLAFVLLTTGQATVVASNISDARSTLDPFGSLTASLSGTSPSLNCNNATAVAVVLALSGATTFTISNLRQGVPVSVYATNSSGASQTLTISASAPSGLAITVNHVPYGSPTGASAFSSIGVANLGTAGWTGVAISALDLCGS